MINQKDEMREMGEMTVMVGLVVTVAKSGCGLVIVS